MRRRRRTKVYIYFFVWNQVSFRCLGLFVCCVIVRVFLWRLVCNLCYVVEGFREGILN